MGIVVFYGPYVTLDPPVDVARVTRGVLETPFQSPDYKDIAIRGGASCVLDGIGEEWEDMDDESEHPYRPYEACAEMERFEAAFREALAELRKVSTATVCYGTLRFRR